jgi:hypothetical protein
MLEFHDGLLISSDADPQLNMGIAVTTAAFKANSWRLASARQFVTLDSRKFFSFAMRDYPGRWHA